MRHSLAAIFLIAITLGAQPPAFEVATVRPAAPAEAGGRIATSGDTVYYRNTTLLNALVRAFGFTNGNQVTGPDWIRTERYDISAQTAPNTPKERIPEMLRALLIERFQLKVHQESRELLVYRLTKTTDRAVLRRSTAPSEEYATVNGQREIRHMNMAGLATFLSLTLRAPVLDATHIEGYYDFVWPFSLEERPGTDSPSIFTLAEELGLKIEASKAPLNVLVVEEGNKIPLAN